MNIEVYYAGVVEDLWAFRVHHFWAFKSSKFSSLDIHSFSKVLFRDKLVLFILIFKFVFIIEFLKNYKAS